MRLRPACMLGLLALSAGFILGCSSNGSNAWEDPRYATLMETADSIFKLGHVSQAAQQYAAALDQAFLSNDPQAIHDAGFNLATSQLRMKAYRDCLTTLGKVSHALAIRGWDDTQQADLHLIRATVLYRQAHWQESETEAMAAGRSSDVETGYEAYGLIGLDEAELSDRSGLEGAITHLSTSRDSRDQANLQELLIHRDMMDQHWSDAAAAAHILADTREKALDYESMRRALGLQARALGKMGQVKAADDLSRQAADSHKAEGQP